MSGASLGRFLFTLIIIASCLMLGKGCALVFGFLPASLYGMLFFALILSSGKFNTEAIGSNVAKMLYFMPIVFLPVCIGVMQYGELILSAGWKILLVGVTTSLITLLLSAQLANVFERGQNDA